MTWRASLESGATSNRDSVLDKRAGLRCQRDRCQRVFCRLWEWSQNSELK